MGGTPASHETEQPWIPSDSFRIPLGFFKDPLRIPPGFLLVNLPQPPSLLTGKPKNWVSQKLLDVIAEM